jgi:hypothetical protein
MPGIGSLIVTIVACAVGMTSVLCGVFYFSIGSLRREFVAQMAALKAELVGKIDTLRAEMTVEFGKLRSEIANTRTEEFKQKVMAGAK